MAQLMPLSLTVSCFTKIQIGCILRVLAHLGSPGKRAVKRVCVCVCVCLFVCLFNFQSTNKHRQTTRRCNSGPFSIAARTSNMPQWLVVTVMRSFSRLRGAASCTSGIHSISGVRQIDFMLFACDQLMFFDLSKCYRHILEYWFWGCG